MLGRLNESSFKGSSGSFKGDWGSFLKPATTFLLAVAALQPRRVPSKDGLRTLGENPCDDKKLR